jgi:subtilase family serine protease
MHEPGVGGTSCASPLWAGLCRAGQPAGLVGRQPDHRFSSTRPFTRIGKGSSYNADFHDVKTGNNFSPEQHQQIFCGHRI